MEQISNDIFNGNRKLEENVMQGIDWGIFLRRDLTCPIFPFMDLYNGKEKNIRVMPNADDPVEFAKKILENEEKPYQQIVIGYEGILRDESGNGTDAIIIHGFDVTQEKGVTLAQTFMPKEKGEFKRLGKIVFMGNPDLITEKREILGHDYNVDEVAYNAIVLNKDNLNAYLVMLTHENPSAIINTVKLFFRNKFVGENSKKLSGDVELSIPPGVVKNEELLTFLMTETAENELNSDLIRNWEKGTNRKVKLVCKHGDKIIYGEKKGVGKKENAEKKEVVNKKEENFGYDKLSDGKLHDEYYRILKIPGARTNIDALQRMAALMDEFERRNIQTPHDKVKQAVQGSNTGCAGVLVIAAVIVSVIISLLV